MNDPKAPSFGDATADPGTVFAAFAQIVYASDSFHDVFQALCRAAPQLVAGCDHEPDDKPRWRTRSWSTRSITVVVGSGHVSARASRRDGYAVRRDICQPREVLDEPRPHSASVVARRPVRDHPHGRQPEHRG